MAAGTSAGGNVRRKQEEAVTTARGTAAAAKSASPAGSAYTPLDSSGNDYAGMSGMSDVHKAALDAAKQSWSAANAAGDAAGKDAAHRQAEAVRALYSYSGGSDGSQYLPFEQQKFSYEAAPSYVNRYQEKIDALASEILNREAFQYDPETDPAYQQYRKGYTREGQRAMQDTLGQMSARTGGLASSYAGSAAQQTYDNYMGRLADKIPELRELAYSMYMDDLNQNRADLEMLMALEQNDYGRYAGQLGQYNADRAFDYGVFADDRGYAYQRGRDAAADERYAAEFDYQRGRDQIADSRYADETAWERSQYESETAYNQALQKAQMLAAAGDFSGYRGLGYSDSEIATLQNAYDAAQLAAAARSSGGGGGRSSSGGGDDSIWSVISGMENESEVERYLLEEGVAQWRAEDYLKLWRQNVQIDESKVSQIYNNIMNMKRTEAERNDPDFEAKAIAAYDGNTALSLSQQEAARLLQMFGYDPAEWLE